MVGLLIPFTLLQFSAVSIKFHVAPLDSTSVSKEVVVGKGNTERDDREGSLVRTVCRIQQLQCACVCACMRLRTTATATQPLFICPSSLHSLLGIWQRQTTVFQKWAAAWRTNRLKEEEEGEMERVLQSSSSFVFCLAASSSVGLWNWSQHAADLNPGIKLMQ